MIIDINESNKVIKINRKYKQTLKQKYRQRFGFFMEELIGSYFRSKGILTLSHNWNHIDEWGNNYEINWKLHMAKLFNTLKKHKYFKNTLKTSLEYYKKINNYVINEEDSRSKIILNAVKTKDNNFLKAYVIQGLIRSNEIELLRFENSEPIVSEIKAAYGPEVSNIVEFGMDQIETLQYIHDLGIKSTLIYLIALPEPHFIELPFTEIIDIKKYQMSLRLKKPNSHKVGIGRSRVRIKISNTYKNIKLYTYLNNNLYSYKNLRGLLKLLQKTKTHK